MRMLASDCEVERVEVEPVEVEPVEVEPNLPCFDTGFLKTSVDSEPHFLLPKFV